MQEHVLSYGDLTERWKVDLIVQRARHFGIPEHDWPDLQQSIILDILNFRYDKENPQGAEERTVITTLIDNKIIDLLRKQSIRDKYYQDLLIELGLTDPQKESFSYLPNHALSCDIQESMVHLSPREKDVCYGLMEGFSIRQMARKLRCRQESVRLMIQNIRRIFKELGMDKWMQ